MSLVGSWLPIELSAQVDPDFQWGGFNFPAIEGGEGAVTDVQALLLSFMVLKDTAHPDEALDFLRFLMTKEQQEAMVDVGIVGVTHKDVAWPAPLADAEGAAANATAMFPDVDGVYAKYAEYLNTVLWVNYSELWQGNMTPDEFVEAMVSDQAAYWAAH